MSSERNGRGDEASADDVPEQDPWFAPARRAGGTASADGVSSEDLASAGLAPDGTVANGAGAMGARANGASPSGASPRGAGQAAEWFLRTGRAGLLPDSVTRSTDDEALPEWPHEAAGAPPWAGDLVQTDGEPPPWEYGPWPGPGEARQAPGSPAAGRLAGAGSAAAIGAQEDADRNWQARAALVTGVLPLVVPGIVLGVLGLRRARDSRSGDAFSWLGIALSVVWAVILGVVVFGSSGPSAGGCTVPNGVRASYALVMRDLSATNLEASFSSGVLAADAHHAAIQANGAAASAGEVPLRGALAAVADDLQQVQAALPSHPGTGLPKSARLQLGSLRSRLGSDVTALSRSCAG